MTHAPARIVPLADTGDAGRLRGLAEAIFGGAREEGWFDRKLLRECVDPALSQVAVMGDATDPTAWIGYVLVGRPASRWPTARTAGTGVLAPHRGRGVARALLDAATTACERAGADTLELSAERSLEAFYATCGFEIVARTATLVARGRGGPGSAREPAGAWHEGVDAIEIHAWLREAWERTPGSERTTIRIASPAAVMHVSAEVGGWAIHRTQLVATEPRPVDDAHVAYAAADALDAALERLPAAQPVFAIAVPEVSSITLALHHHGWRDAQRATVVARRLRAHSPAGQAKGRPG